MLAKYCPPQIWEKRNNTEMYLTFPNGSILYVLGADKPDALRGPNPKGVVLDEYDDMRPEIWSAIIQPIMIANPNSWCWFVGTYKGVRDLYKKFQYAQDNPNWFSYKLKASESGIIAPEDLEEAKKTTTQDFFKQEYECEAIEGAGSFFRGIDQCIWDGTMPYDRRRSYQIGVDLAKYQDYTVVTPFDLTSFKAGIPERFNQIDYTLQKARIEATYLRYGKAKVIMDSTGVGEPIFDDLRGQRIQNIEAFHFTENSRRDLLVNLQILIEQGKIQIPNYEPLINELRAFQYVLGDRGKVKIAVPEGMHDDCVMSLALAVWNIPERHISLKGEEERKLVKEFDAHTRKKTYLSGSPYINKW